MRVIHLFSYLQYENFQCLNSANIALLPKKDGTEEIIDFRRISLIRALAKVLAKVLATHLAPFMCNLVSNAQSAFIKKRSIHDNFMYFRNTARRLHITKKATLLFKLDIRRAFDSVRLDYILEIMQRRGFLPRFRDWIASLLPTSSSHILVILMGSLVPYC